jgi:alkaline phosphatase
MKFRHRRLIITLLAIASFVPGVQWLSNSTSEGQKEPAAPKYVFFFLADGAGIPHMEITRLYNKVVYNEGLVIADKILKEGALGLITTHAADSLSTDSAAAATALAGGCKANIGMLGMCADGTVPKSAMEIARDKRMRIALVTTSTIYDASPAGFVTHVPSRRDFPAIVNRFYDLEPYVLLGGGRDQFLAKGQPGSQRNDGTDMIAAFVKKGYDYVTNKQELDKSQRGKLLGLFGIKEMSFELDRDNKTEPSLVDMTRATIRHLQNDNSNGFFAFIENENVDSAGHLNDVASLIEAYREFDKAVGVAYDFYRKYPRETLIIVTSDHETGGLGFTLALRDLNSSRGSNQVAATVDDLKKLHSIPISLKKAEEILGPSPDGAAIDALMKDYFKGFTMAPDIKEAILKRQPLSRALYSDLTANALGMMVANNTQAYWQTSSHTNHPVFVAALGPGAEKFRGYQDNAEFGKKLKAIIEARKSR